MKVNQATAKLYCRFCDASSETLVALFHRWIREQRLDALLIDVANYGHVHHGPGVMLIGHGCEYAIDDGQGRRGLRYRARRDDLQAAATASRRALRQTVQIAMLLEQELPAAIAFATDELLLGFDDRLNAPNTRESLDSLEGDLRAVGTAICPDGPLKIEHIGGLDACFCARLLLASSVGLPAMAAALG